MKLQFIKLATFCICLLFLTACSSQNKSSDTTSTEPKTEKKQGQRPQGQKGERPTFAKLLKEMDENNDGKLSKTEVKGPLQKNFTKIDENNDGFISADEFKNSPPPPRKRN